MSETSSKELSDQNCNGQLPFEKCAASIRIRKLLHKCRKIRFDKTDVILDEISNPFGYVHVHAPPLNNDISKNTEYSISDALNDFDHIKYIHDVDLNTDQLNSYCTFVDVSCDINDCHYYRRRMERSQSSASEPNQIGNNIRGLRSLNFICRIHIYFTHTSNTSKLTKQEIQQITAEMKQSTEDEDTLDDITLQRICSAIAKKQKSLSSTVNVLKKNNSKFITDEEIVGLTPATTNTELDFKAISTIFKKHNIEITQNQLVNVCNKYEYDKLQLITDLCDIIFSENDGNVVLAAFLRNELNCNDQQRQTIYDALFIEYINHADLDNSNVIKVIKIVAAKRNYKINHSEIENIAVAAKLSGYLFVNGSSEFMKSTSFAALFYNTTNWNKKEWVNIYRAIRKWKTIIAKKKKKAPKQQTLSPKMIIPKYMSDDEDSKSAEEYMDEGTDKQYVQQFCAITNSTEEDAVIYLNESHWNVMFAVGKYYADSKQTENLKQQNVEKQMNEKFVAIYSHGVSFWYWNEEKKNKRYIKSKFTNLKEEMLNIAEFSIKHWTYLTDECNILIKTQRMKQMTSNGNGVNIYNIPINSLITLSHLCSVKMYTDYSWLCKIFCDSFRLKKISKKEYERVQSLQRRNEKIATWARLLIETVQCFGKFVTGKTKYYRGINMKFMFGKFVTKFNVPLSTTIDFLKAVQFAQGSNGIIIQLKGYNEYISGLDCSAISEFGEEKEVLFFGGDSIFQISTIWQYFDEKWQSYRKYIAQIQNLVAIANGSINSNAKNNINDVVTHLLSDTPILPPYIASLLDYHLNNLSKTFECNMYEITNEYQWVKNIFLNQKSKHLPNISNIFNLFKNCNHVKIKMIDMNVMNYSFCMMIIEDTLNVERKVEVELYNDITFPADIDKIEETLKSCGRDHSDFVLRTKSTTRSISFSVTKTISHVAAIRHEVKKSKMLKTFTEKPLQPGLLGFNTSKYKDNLLVFGYAREETKQCDIYVSKDIQLLFFEMYHLHFLWAKETSKMYSLNASHTKLTLDENKLRAQGLIFHTAFLQPNIASFEKYKFEFMFNGPLNNGKEELAIGVAHADYSTPLIASKAGVGDCKHSASIYMSGQLTTIYFRGKEQKRYHASVMDGDRFTFTVQNLEAENKCSMILRNESFEDGYISYTAPFKCDRIGVSVCIANGRKSQLELELVNFDAKI